MTDDEIDRLRQGGIYPSSLETIRSRFAAQVAAGAFTQEVADRRRSAAGPAPRAAPMELESVAADRATEYGSLMQRNKVYAVTTFAKVAQDLGETIELLDDLTDQMDTEDGLIWVYGADGNPVLALSNDGIECLQGLIADHRSEQE